MSYYKNRFKYNHSQKQKEFTIDDIPLNFQCAKFFLTLHFTDFIFEWELIKKHNLTRQQIQKFSENLNKLGLISFRIYTDLSENMQEAIMKVTPDFEKIYKQNPKVYIITPQGKQAGKQVIVNILKDIGTNQGVYDLVQQLSKQSLSFRKIKKKILTEEKGMIARKVKFPNGVIIEKNTKAYINLLKVIKSRKLSNSEGTQLKTQSTTALTITEQVKEDLKKERKPYSGIYSHLTGTELELQMKEVNLKDLKPDKEYSKGFKEHIKQINMDGYRETLIMQGLPIMNYEKKQIHKKGLEYLEMLSNK